jgi:hypothetical protein
MIAAAGLALAPQADRPDILVEREGSTAALRSSSGNLIFPPATASSYRADNWLLADGDDRDVAAASNAGVSAATVSAASAPSRARPWRWSPIRAPSKKIAGVPLS